MTTEINSRAERESSHWTGKRLVLVYCPEVDGISPHVVNSTDPLRSSIEEEAEMVKGRIKALDDKRSNIRERNSHGRRISKRQLREERESLEHQLDRQREKLRVLEGDEIIPVVREEGGEIKVGHFRSKEEATLWRSFANRTDEIDSLRRRLPEALTLISRAINLRHRKKYALNIAEEREANAAYDKFASDFMRLPEDKAELLGPYIEEITKEFS